MISNSCQVLSLWVRCLKLFLISVTNQRGKNKKIFWRKIVEKKVSSNDEKNWSCSSYWKSNWIKLWKLISIFWKDSQGIHNNNRKYPQKLTLSKNWRWPLRPKKFTTNPKKSPRLGDHHKDRSFYFLLLIEREKVQKCHRWSSKDNLIDLLLFERRIPKPFNSTLHRNRSISLWLGFYWGGFLKATEIYRLFPFVLRRLAESFWFSLSEKNF